MVAYSFAPMFYAPVSSLVKRQTVRADRKRHARPGEAVQLYAGMRTRHCRKLVDPDPICIGIYQIGIELKPGCPLIIRSIEIDGWELDDEEIEAFAVADGFAPKGPASSARQQMGLFWLKNHPDVRFFGGVVIRWEPQ